MAKCRLLKPERETVRVGLEISEELGAVTMAVCAVRCECR